MPLDRSLRPITSRQNPAVARARALARASGAEDALIEGATLVAEDRRAGFGAYRRDDGGRSERGLGGGEAVSHAGGQLARSVLPAHAAPAAGVPVRSAMIR